MNDKRIQHVVNKIIKRAKGITKKWRWNEFFLCMFVSALRLVTMLLLANCNKFISVDADDDDDNGVNEYVTMVLVSSTKVMVAMKMN